MTGNTEKIARAIQIGEQQAAGHCDILPIKEANPRRLSEYDLIGLGTPVIGMSHPTTNVNLFIKNMRFVGGKHIFSFCTHNTLWNTYFYQVVPKLKKRGLVVIGWGHWFGSAFGPLGEQTPHLTDGHPDDIDLQDAEAFGREMVWRSQRIYGGENNLIPVEPTLPPPLFGELREMAVPKDDENHAVTMKFHLNYNKEKCLYPKCRLCMDHCPMDGIDLSMDPPVIGKPCMTCMMCDQLCPTGAIEVDEAQMLDHKRVDEELGFKGPAIQRCREYEKQGIFRRLIPEEKVGWDRPIYKVYNKHPRFVIGKGRPYGMDPWSWGKLK